MPTEITRTSALKARGGRYAHEGKQNHEPISTLSGRLNGPCEYLSFNPAWSNTKPLYKAYTLPSSSNDSVGNASSARHIAALPASSANTTGSSPLPVVLLLGASATSGTRLASLISEYGKLYHLDVRKWLVDIVRYPIVRLPHYINSYVQRGEMIPSYVIEAEYGGDETWYGDGRGARDVPILLQVYQHLKSMEPIPLEKVLPLLQEKISKISSSPVSSRPAGILLDSLPQAVGQAVDAENQISGTLANLTIELTYEQTVSRPRALRTVKSCDDALILGKGHRQIGLDQTDASCRDVQKFHELMQIRVTSSTRETWAELRQELYKSHVWKGICRRSLKSDEMTAAPYTRSKQYSKSSVDIMGAQSGNKGCPKVLRIGVSHEQLRKPADSYTHCTAEPTMQDLPQVLQIGKIYKSRRTSVGLAF
ncbi:MAG: hypothetical protein M1820_007692 [Bogoriella megaspora]|nr:MAG: hypothetical protein M1820_007692 [Bogoriella megaspora]